PVGRAGRPWTAVATSRVVAAPLPLDPTAPTLGIAGPGGPPLGGGGPGGGGPRATPPGGRGAGGPRAVVGAVARRRPHRPVAARHAVAHARAGRGRRPTHAAPGRRPTARRPRGRGVRGG